METPRLQTAGGLQARSRLRSLFRPDLPAGLPVGGVNPAALLGSWPMNEETWLIEANGPLQLSAADLQNKLPFTSHLLKLNSELIQHA